jgi:hypothetical protein
MKLKNLWLEWLIASLIFLLLQLVWTHVRFESPWSLEATSFLTPLFVGFALTWCRRLYEAANFNRSSLSVLSARSIWFVTSGPNMHFMLYSISSFALGAGNFVKLLLPIFLAEAIVSNLPGTKGKSRGRSR